MKANWKATRVAVTAFAVSATLLGTPTSLDAQKGIE